MSDCYHEFFFITDQVNYAGVANFCLCETTVQNLVENYDNNTDLHSKDKN